MSVFELTLKIGDPPSAIVLDAVPNRFPLMKAAVVLVLEPVVPVVTTTLYFNTELSDAGTHIEKLEFASILPPTNDIAPVLFRDGLADKLEFVMSPDPSI